MKPTEIEVTIHLDDDTSVTITADGKRPAEVIARVLGAFTKPCTVANVRTLAQPHDEEDAS